MYMNSSSDGRMVEFNCAIERTFHRGRHNVHVCKQLDGYVILDTQCTQV